MSNQATDEDGALKTGQFLLAVGILARTTDTMILNDSAVPRLRKALSLVKKYEDTFEEFGAFLRNQLSNFESRHPQFPIEQFVDRIFEHGPASWPNMKAEFRAIWQECLRPLAHPTFIDLVRDNMPEAYNTLLECIAEDDSIVGETLDRIDEM